MGFNSPTVDDVMTAVDGLLPEIANRAQEIEAARRVPADLVQKLKTAGCFRMAVPRSLGGIGCFREDLFVLYETLAAADASAAWIVMIGGPTPNYLAFFPETTFSEVFAEGPDVVMAAALAPTGRADVVDGGYRAQGRWQWCSGSAHADWVLCNCVIYRDGEPIAGPTPAYPAMRSLLLPAAEVELVDTWLVSGLRGTGSGDIALRNVFVADGRSAELFGQANALARQAPAVGGAIGPYVAAVALGIARGALDDIVALAAADKRRLGAASPLADDALFQHRLGEADAQLRAARQAFYAQLQAWEQLPEAERSPLHPVVTETNATALWVTRTAASVVDTAYHAAGGSAVWESAALQRRFRDIHTATQHISVSEAIYGRAGAGLLAA
jgi:alkylation response protein AidB-like acyl-CoA dehydrogenase